MVKESLQSDIWRVDWRSVDGRGEPPREWYLKFLENSRCPVCGVRAYPMLPKGTKIPAEIIPKRPFSHFHRTPFHAVPDKILETVIDEIAPHVRYAIVDSIKGRETGWSAIRYDESSIVRGVVLDNSASETTCKKCKKTRYDRVPKIGLPKGFMPTYSWWCVSGFEYYSIDSFVKKNFWNNFRKDMLLYPAEYAQKNRSLVRIKKHSSKS